MVLHGPPTDRNSERTECDCCSADRGGASCCGLGSAVAATGLPPTMERMRPVRVAGRRRLAKDPRADVGGVGSTTTGEEFPPQWPPGECLFDGALGGIRCLTALRSWCLSATTEEECEGYEPYLFDGTGRYLSCGWVAVVPVVDVQSCEVGSISFRCEATAGTWGPPPQTDPSCASTGIWSFGEGELVSMGTSTYLVGPLGPWNDYDNPEAPEPPTPAVGERLLPMSAPASTSHACSRTSDAASKCRRFEFARPPQTQLSKRASGPGGPAERKRERSPRADPSRVATRRRPHSPRRGEGDGGRHSSDPHRAAPASGPEGPRSGKRSRGRDENRTVQPPEGAPTHPNGVGATQGRTAHPKTSRPHQTRSGRFGRRSGDVLRNDRVGYEHGVAERNGDDADVPLDEVDADAAADVPKGHDVVPALG